MEISYLLVLKDASWTEGESPDRLSTAKEWTRCADAEPGPSPERPHHPRFLSFFALGAVVCFRNTQLPTSLGRRCPPCLLLSGCLHLCVFGHICTCRENPHVVKLLVLGRSEGWGDTVTRIQCRGLVGGLSQWGFGIPCTKPGSREASFNMLCQSQSGKCEIQNNWRVMCVSTAEAELTVERGLCSYHTGNNLKASFPISLQVPNKLLGNFSSLPFFFFFLLLYLWTLSPNSIPFWSSTFCYLLISSTVHQMLFSHCDLDYLDFQNVFNSPFSALPGSTKPNAKHLPSNERLLDTLKMILKM